MSKKVYLKPCPDRTVRDPADPAQPIPIEGKQVELTPFWQRRIKDGDVVLTAAPKKGGK
jgi:hypothetical protein